MDLLGVTRTIDQPWRYPNPSGPGTRYTAFSKSGDGRTRIYWRWLEGGTLERDGETPMLRLATPGGQVVYRLRDNSVQRNADGEHWVSLLSNVKSSEMRPRGR